MENTGSDSPKRSVEAQRDELLRAFSDHSRRRILKALYHGPLPVHQLALHLEDPTRINYHLRVLRAARIVRSVKDRYRNVFYECIGTSVAELRKILEEIPSNSEAASDEEMGGS